MGDLATAIQSRDVIGQPRDRGGRRHLTADLAFEVLRQLSQDHDQRLADLAEQMARTGEVPEADPSPTRAPPSWVGSHWPNPGRSGATTGPCRPAHA
jgi:hypothetical protein